MPVGAPVTRTTPPAFVLGDLTLVRPLALAGIDTVLASTDPDDPARWSRLARRSLVLPPLTGRNEAAALRALCLAVDSLVGREGPRPLFVYGSDEALAFVHRNRAALGARFAIALGDDDLLSAALDKQRFHERANRLGVRTPDALEVGESLDEAPRLGPMAMVKPRSKHESSAHLMAWLGGAKARRVATAESGWREELASVRSEIVVQRRVPHDIADLVSIHGYADESGAILASFVGRKIRTHPRESGGSSCVGLVDDPALERAGLDVARRLGVVGPFKLDLVRDGETGELVTLELNARFTLWSYLGAVHGVNLPLVAYRSLVEGRHLAPPFVRPRVRWIDLDRDFRARRELGVSLPRWLWSLTKTPNVYELFAWDDPLPALVWLGGAVRDRVRTRCASG